MLESAWGMPVLPSQLPDHRRSDEATLVEALRAREPLALAEVYHRTVAAANACARRLLQSPAQVEGLLRAVYTELWQSPPRDVPLEGWVRARTFALAVGDLRGRGEAPASPSTSALLPTLPAPQARFLDAAERALSELDDRTRMVVLRAHDSGMGTRAQGGDAESALDKALRALAGPEPSNADATALREDPCTDVRGMGDWVLGLLDATSAAELEALTTRRPGCAALARTLRRGRRRLEGLPPTPDMGFRILASVLPVGSQPAQAPATAASHAPPRAPHPHPALVGVAAGSAEVATGDLAPTGELRMADLPRSMPPPAAVASAAIANDWSQAPTLTGGSSRAVAGVATRDDEQARVIDLREQAPAHDAEDGTAVIGRRRDPYAALAELDEADDSLELPNPHRVTRTGRLDMAEQDTGASRRLDAPDLDSAELESLYPEEELITRPSIGQRLLVIVGYVMPIVLGAGLGLYIADLLFPR